MTLICKQVKSEDLLMHYGVRAVNRCPFPNFQFLAIFGSRKSSHMKRTWEKSFFDDLRPLTSKIDIKIEFVQELRNFLCTFEPPISKWHLGFHYSGWPQKWSKISWLEVPNQLCLLSKSVSLEAIGHLKTAILGFWSIGNTKAHAWGAIWALSKIKCGEKILSNT